MGTLNVPGARLDYRVVGEGPLLVLIAGGPGRAPSTTRLAQHLAPRCRVLTYDRHG